MLKPRTKMADPEDFVKYIGPTPEQIAKRHEKYAKDQAHCAKVMYDAYIAEGFTEEQAIKLIVARPPVVVSY